MKVVCHHTSQEFFISKLFFVEIVDQEENLDNIFFDHLCFESWYLGSHLGLQKLHQNGQQVLMLLVIQSELRHDLTGKDDSAFAQSILYVCVDPIVFWTILAVE